VHVVDVATDESSIAVNTGGHGVLAFATSGANPSTVTKSRRFITPLQKSGVRYRTAYPAN
jgi:hypothetical protein